MRLRRLILLLVLSLWAAAAPARAQSSDRLPHAWLFGTWSGGLFPASPDMTAAECLAQPVVIFTRDVVLRATLLDVGYLQFPVQTARTAGASTEFAFPPAAGAPHGFCGNDAPLHIERKSAREIAFVGCADFPNPLVRCPGS